MRRAFVVVVLVIACGVAASSLAAADECAISDAAVTKEGGFVPAVEAAVKAAPDCERSYKVLDACQLGSSGDNALAEIVRGKCEPLFQDKASPATKAAYKNKRIRCNRIAKNNEGTMYLGLAAVCQAKAARDFANKYGSR